jgi:hypothetical protein
MRGSALGAAAAVLLAWPMPAHASLIGATIGGQLNSGSAAVVVTQFSPASAVVGPGVEFQGVLREPNFGQTFSIAIDLDATTVTVAITGASGNNVSTPPFVNLGGFTLTGLPVSATDIVLDSYSCTGLVPVCSNPVFSSSTVVLFPADSSLTGSFFGLASGQTYVFAVRGAAAVPAPASLALLAAGVLGLAATRRRAPATAG